MNEDIKVSIITVCYNSEKTIQKTIESVLHQSYGNIEYLIIDGASTDHTVEIIKKMEPLFQGRMKWVSEPDQGIYDAMNKGIQKASGQLIGIINSDDFYELDAVTNMVLNYDGKPYQILYGMTRMLKEGKEYAISIQSHEFLNESMISHPSCFITADIYQNLGSYDTAYKSVADYDFMLRMKENKQVTFKPVYQLIANFSLGGMCASSFAYEELIKLRKKYGMISNREYQHITVKNKIYHLFKRK